MVGLDGYVGFIMPVRQVWLQVQLPFGERLIDINVRLDTWDEARRAQNLQPLIEIDAEFAEVFVMRVAQAEHRVTQRLQARRALREQRIAKGFGAVRWIAFAIGTGEEERVFLLGKLGRCGLVERHGLRGVTCGPEFLGHLFGEPLGRAALRREVDRELERNGPRLRRTLRCVRKQAGKEAVEPGALLAGERRIVRDVRNILKHDSSLVRALERGLAHGAELVNFMPSREVEEVFAALARVLKAADERMQRGLHVGVLHGGEQLARETLVVVGRHPRGSPGTLRHLPP